MPALRNAKHEIFAHEIAKGVSSATAYARAGYKAKGHSVDVAASRLLKNVEVVARIDEIRIPIVEDAISTFGVTTKRVVRELELLAFSNFLDYAGVSDISDLTRDQAAAIVEGSVVRTESGISLAKFKLSDKQRALVELLKYCQVVDAAKAAAEVSKGTAPSAARQENVFDLEEMRAKYNVAVPSPAPGCSVNRPRSLRCWGARGSWQGRPTP
jgi:phage terminase small subunit